MTVTVSLLLSLEGLSVLVIVLVLFFPTSSLCSPDSLLIFTLECFMLFLLTPGLPSAPPSFPECSSSGSLCGDSASSPFTGSFLSIKALLSAGMHAISLFLTLHSVPVGQSTYTHWFLMPHTLNVFAMHSEDPDTHASLASIRPRKNKIISFVSPNTNLFLHVSKHCFSA